jgi:hypothetical protein
VLRLPLFLLYGLRGDSLANPNGVLTNGLCASELGRQYFGHVLRRDCGHRH